MPQTSPIRSARSARSIALAACAALLATALPAQTSIGVLGAGEFTSRTVGSAFDGVSDNIDALRDNTGFRFAPAVGIAAERKFNDIVSGALQFRYETAGYTYDLDASPTLDPLTGVRPEGNLEFPLGEARYRYEFLALAIGATEVWGDGRVRFYAEEYLVPMVYLTSVIDDPLRSAGRTRARRDNANDFHIGVRGGVGAQTSFAANMRLRVGVTANYHFTQTFDDADLREHLFGFGPQVSVSRVFGAAGTPEGPGEDIYY